MWLLVVCVFLTVVAQPACSRSVRGADILDPEVSATVAQATGLPSEFCSDAILRMVEYKLVKKDSDVRELLEQSFLCANGAQLPHKRLGGLHTDTLQSRLAWDNKLDRVSLQARSVNLMLERDPNRAREMFETITLPDLSHASCNDCFVSDVSDYYSTLIQIANRGFSPEERREGKHIRFVEDGMRGARTIMQLAPMAKALFRLEVSSAERTRLLQQLMSTLNELRATDREFGVYEDDLVGTAFEAHNAGLDLLPFVPVLRSALIRQYRGPRCTPRMAKNELPLPVRDFNELARRLRAEGKEVEYIDAQEVKPASDSGTFKLDEFWSSDVSRQVRRSLQSLTFRDGRYVDPKQRAGPEWTARFHEDLRERYYDLLRQTENWTEDDEMPPQTYFHMKAVVFHQLVTLLPDGPLREDAFFVLQTLLEKYYGSTENRNEWFTEVDLTFSILSRWETADAARVLRNLELRTRNPVLALYAHLQLSKLNSSLASEPR